MPKFTMAKKLGNAPPPPPRIMDMVEVPNEDRKLWCERPWQMLLDTAPSDGVRVHRDVVFGSGVPVPQPGHSLMREYNGYPSLYRQG